MREAFAQRHDVDAHLREDLGSAPDALDVLREGAGAVIEQFVGPLAQLHDARVAGAQLVGGVGDLVVVELVEVERLTEVRAHGRQRLAQILRRPVAELGDSAKSSSSVVVRMRSSTATSAVFARRASSASCASSAACSSRLRLPHNPAMDRS